VTGPFLVAAAPPAIPRLTAASPRSADRGSTVDVALEGANTAFVNGASFASVSGTGVQVLSTTVRSPTSAVARLRIADGAPLGFRDLEVTTGAQDAALLDGFEVTAPARPASGAASGASGGGSSTTSARPITCVDRARPTASFLQGRKGVALAHGKLVLHGRARDRGCTAAISVAGKVARVEVAISRKAGKRCRFVDARGRLGKARSCAKPVWLKARGTAAWSLSLKRKLPSGTYTIQVRARDAAGNRQGTAAKRSQRIR
jgi:hypothetical protein